MIHVSLAVTRNAANASLAEIASRLADDAFPLLNTP